MGTLEEVADLGRPVRPQSIANVSDRRPSMSHARENSFFERILKNAQRKSSIMGERAHDGSSHASNGGRRDVGALRAGRPIVQCQVYTPRKEGGGGGNWIF